jgi:hypothetical protein
LSETWNLTIVSRVEEALYLFPRKTKSFQMLSQRLRWPLLAWIARGKSALRLRVFAPLR